MKQVRKLGVALGVLLLLAVGNAAWAQEKQLVVMHTSDTHSRVDPLADNPSLRDAGMGGIARRAGLVELSRKEHPGLLLFDCGDLSQGTPYYNLYKGEIEIKAMNLMGYDAMGIGNHEFDFGMDNMVRLFTMAQFPVVCANYDFTGTVLEGVVKPYTVLEREGVRIGVFGLSPEMEGLVQKSKCEGVRYIHPVEAANKVVDVLRNSEHCDVVICLSHLGIVSKPEEGDLYDNAVLPHTRGIDLVLGGHTHTFMKEHRLVQDADGNEVPVMHIGNNGVYMSETILTLQKAEAN